MRLPTPAERCSLFVKTILMGFAKPLNNIFPPLQEYRTEPHHPVVLTGTVFSIAIVNKYNGRGCIATYTQRFFKS